jgi:hypothetical protein
MESLREKHARVELRVLGEMSIKANVIPGNAAKTEVNPTLFPLFNTARSTPAPLCTA